MNGKKNIKGSTVKDSRKGFTVVELLVVLGIISLLVGLLIPALNLVRNKAKQAKQLAQFNAIEMALTTFRNDHGDYPSSNWLLPPAVGSDYCGAQKLAEALLGWDLLGFHPKSDLRSNGYNDNGIFVYDTNDPILLSQRTGPYLELAATNAFRLGDISIFKPGIFLDTSPLAPDTYVLCDEFTFKKIKLRNGKVVTAGSPILYYRANTSEKTIRGIYDAYDNDALIQIKQRADNREHPLSRSANQFQYFYEYIRDPKIDVRAWPYRPDSYLLISAGPDGLYGTGDDICNFGN